MVGMVGYGAKDPSTKSLTSTMSDCFTVLMIFYGKDGMLW